MKRLIAAEPPSGPPLHDGLLCYFPHWHRSGAGAQGRVGTGNFCILPGKIFTWQFQETGGAALLIFQGIATGSLLYVVFFEILEKERAKDVNGFAQAVSMCFGYTLLVLLTMLEPQVRQIVISYIRSLSLMTLILW